MSHCVPQLLSQGAGAAEGAPEAPTVGRMSTSCGLALPATDISSSLDPNMDLQHGKKGVRGRRSRWVWHSSARCKCPHPGSSWAAEMAPEHHLLQHLLLLLRRLPRTFLQKGTFFPLLTLMPRKCFSPGLFLSKTTEMVKLISGQWLVLSYNNLTQAQCS